MFAQFILKKNKQHWRLIIDKLTNVNWWLSDGMVSIEFETKDNGYFDQRPNGPWYILDYSWKRVEWNDC